LFKRFHFQNFHLFFFVKDRISSEYFLRSKFPKFLHFCNNFSLKISRIFFQVKGVENDLNAYIMKAKTDDDISPVLFNVYVGGGEEGREEGGKREGRGREKGEGREERGEREVGKKEGEGRRGGRLPNENKIWRPREPNRDQNVELGLQRVPRLLFRNLRGLRGYVRSFFFSDFLF
jgi:hypothetical protein